MQTILESEPRGELNSDLASQIRDSSDRSPITARLLTDERVLARVTDGIYRQPASAIRELVSNAYDADATQVVIRTDRPRFRTLTVDDDGIGMTPDVLAHLLQHIGGSAKRMPEGPRLGIASSADPTRSPGGRKLIGKIGIGLFSVSQLTQTFQIITKTAGDEHRTVASVVLKQFSEEGTFGPEEPEQYESGLVTVWREPAKDSESHGTSIVLTNLRPGTRETLQSRELWAAIDSDREQSSGTPSDVVPPRFNIGRVQSVDSNLLEGDVDPYFNLPWSHGDQPRVAFEKLVKAVWGQGFEGISNPQIERIFDYYLRMVWQLSLSIPAPYVSGNPFDLPIQGKLDLFGLPQATKEPPKEIQLDCGQTIRAKTSIGSASDVGGDFIVLVDDLQLARPLIFDGLPETRHQVKKPIVFAGKCREEFADIPAEFNGGPLEFEAYLMWAPKIAPTEHQGVLIRIHGSSGTLFDPTFLRYQVSELTRLRQITCEIFVSEGLESALNIDRESFNYAHPHAVLITTWLHASLRRLATVQKRIAAQIRAATREEVASGESAELAWIASQAWQYERDDPGAEPPSVEFDSDSNEPDSEGFDGYRFSRELVFGRRKGRRTTADDSNERKLRTMAQILAAYGILESLTSKQQERLLAGLRRVLEISRL